MKTLNIAAAMALLSLPLAATAGGGYTSGVVNAGQDAWYQEAMYEPCMNGDVSASGMFSSQLSEDKAVARMSVTYVSDL